MNVRMYVCLYVCMYLLAFMHGYTYAQYYERYRAPQHQQVEVCEWRENMLEIVLY